jgi:hypothetical protein
MLLGNDSGMQHGLGLAIQAADRPGNIKEGSGFCKYTLDLVGVGN